MTINDVLLLFLLSSTVSFRQLQVGVAVFDFTDFDRMPLLCPPKVCLMFGMQQLLILRVLRLNILYNGWDFGNSLSIIFRNDWPRC